jgi:DNA (cytosine-5)-methyltransferase 1
LQALDNSITQHELDDLVALGILKKINYTYKIQYSSSVHFTEIESLIISHADHELVTLGDLKSSLKLKKIRSKLDEVINGLVEKRILINHEMRYEFRYTKISTGIEGINRIFLPKSEAFPTLVASDTNDFVALKNIEAETEQEYKELFLREVFHKKLFRKISKQEACLIQGFPKDFILPESRSRWMKLIGNSVSVPVVQMLAQSIISTGCFDNEISSISRCAA